MKIFAIRFVIPYTAKRKAEINFSLERSPSFQKFVFNNLSGVTKIIL